MAKISTKKNLETFNTIRNKKNDNSAEFPYQPGNNVITTILNYSKSLSIRKSISIGYFEIVLS